MVFLVIETGVIGTPSSNTVHRLTAAAICALQVTVGIRTAVPVVGRTLTDLVASASLILVIVSIVVARAIWIPSSNTVHWLTATTRRTRLIVVSLWAAIAVVGSVFGDLVQSASSVLVIGGGVLACSICSPSTNTVHWLTATTCGADLVVVGIGATITIVGRIFADLIVFASPVLMVTVVGTRSVSTPISDAVHWLAATTSGTLVIVIAVWTRFAIMGRVFADLVLSALLVLVSPTVVMARPVCSPSSYTVHRLTAATSCAGYLVVCKRASVTIVAC